MEDPYQVLGVERTATQAEIQKAYRALAKRHHPDLNPGKPEAEARFKDVSGAYSLLSDPEKRARFDRGEIDASGAERPPERQFYRDFGDAAGGSRYRSEPEGDGEDLESFFSQAFGGKTGRTTFKMRGSDARYSLTVDFLDAANGAVRRLPLPDGHTLDVTIPAGLRDGQTLRLSGRGHPGVGGGPPGDALIEVSIAPHPVFRRDGNDVVMDVPVTLREAVLGAEIQVPTMKRPVKVKVPPRSSSGTRLRLKGRGIQGGDLYVQLTVALPTEDEPELRTFLEGWKPSHPFDPRAGLS